MQQIIRKLLFLLSLVPFAVTSAEAQTKVKGTVSDELQKPAGFATVRLSRAADSAVVKSVLTTINGEFVFEEVVSGIYQITVEWILYRSDHDENKT